MRFASALIDKLSEFTKLKKLPDQFFATYRELNEFIHMNYLRY
jgi:hypothetical protein